MRRIFPYPLLAGFVVLAWLLLSGFTPGQFVLAVGVAVIAGCSMVRLQPEKVYIQNWHLLPKLLWRVIVDVTVSNLSVVYIILTGVRSRHQLGFMTVPLDLQNRTGLAVLACILTATPGTVWISYDSKSSELTLHVLDLADEAYWRELIKSRYESLLLEIFK